MACFHPWQMPRKDQNGRAWRDLVPLTLACGQCIGCKVARTEEWGVRVHHEAQMHEANCFVTLTYSDDFLPENYSLDVSELQRFMKRLRRSVAGKIRFFACGEYGENNGRPHYHVIVFGWSPPDAQVWRRTSSGHLVYRSAHLEKVWPFGHVEVGSVTKQSARYVAGYVIKKITGDAAKEHYRRFHPITGEVCQVRPEFLVMSNRPGIGSSWHDNFSADCFPSDFLIVDGKKVSVPRYYKKKLSEAEQENVSRKRKEKSWQHKDNNTPERLAVREESQLIKMERFKRDLEKPE